MGNLERTIRELRELSILEEFAPVPAPDPDPDLDPDPEEPDPGDPYTTRVLATEPAFYLPLDDLRGATAAADAGPDGAYMNGPQLGLPTLCAPALDATGRSVGLNGASSNPSHIQITSPITGSDISVKALVQFDTISPAKQTIFTRPGNGAGAFAVELLAGGQWRAYSRHATGSGGAAVILSDPAVALQGTVYDVVYERQSGAEPSQRLVVDGVEVAADATIRTWPGVPEGTWYIGCWSTGASAMDGLIGHVAGWNRYLAQGTIESLVHKTDSVVWAVAIAAGTIEAEGSKVVDVRSAGWHGKEPIVASADNGSLVTSSESGPEITLTAGEEGGADSVPYSFTDANGNVAVPPRAITLTVLEDEVEGPSDPILEAVLAAPGQISTADLRAADVYYDAAEMTTTIRNTHNHYAALHRNNFESPHPVNHLNINSKTRRTAGGSRHDALVEPVTDIDWWPMFNQYRGYDGALRFTSRNKAGWDGGSDSSQGALQNFRKHIWTIRRRTDSPHPAFDGTSHNDHDLLLPNQTYACGFTMWLGGANMWIRNQRTSGAFWQLHGSSPVAIYFRMSSNGQWGGFTSAGPGSATQNFPNWAIENNHNTIHVIRMEFRCATNGFLRIWHNGVQRVNVSRAIGVNRPALVFWPAMNYRTAVDLPYNETREWIYWMDRIWCKAL